VLLEERSPQTRDKNEAEEMRAACGDKAQARDDLILSRRVKGAPGENHCQHLESQKRGKR